MDNLDKEVDDFSKRVKNREKDYKALTSLEKEARSEKAKIYKRNDIRYSYIIAFICLVTVVLFTAYVIIPFFSIWNQ